MKVPFINNSKLLRVVFIVPLALTLNCSLAYAKKFPLVAASTVPAARGQVETGKDKNGNTEIKLETEHLAEPDKLTPAKSAYLVWFQERGAEPAMQGQLRIDKKLKGEFKTVTPMKNFDVFVTAESDPAAKTPSGTEVLRATVQQ